MGDKVRDWMFRDAEWWQFWRPQSGLVGGLIFGAVLNSILVLTLFAVLS